MNVFIEIGLRFRRRRIVPASRFLFQQRFFIGLNRLLLRRRQLIEGQGRAAKRPERVHHIADLIAHFS